MVDPYPNTGSTARDQLANERTFLAWVRTGLGFVGLGVVLEKLVTEGGELPRAMGLMFIAAGLGQLIYGFTRYRRVARLLEEGSYAPARNGPMALLAFCVLVAIGAAVLTIL